MPLDWKNVKELHPALQTTGNDVIFSGHGGLTNLGTTTVPEQVEFWVLAPPGGSIADDTGQDLENMMKITQLGIKNPGSDVLVNNTPIVYTAGMQPPNYILAAPRGIVIKAHGPHVLGVETNTPLSDLWQRITPFLRNGKTLRCYWAACTAIAGAKNPVVLCR